MPHGRAGGHALYGVDVEELSQQIPGRHAQFVRDLKGGVVLVLVLVLALACGLEKVDTK